MLIDTHCHLDAAEFDADREDVIKRGEAAGVQAIVIPAVSRANFDVVETLAHSFPGGRYALGIHPIAVPHAQEEDLALLAERAEAALSDERFVGIGEIGLDFFIPALKEPAMRDKQSRFFDAQLKLAQKLALPVIVHVRRSQDEVLKFLRRREGLQGIAHAFNGSFQQAEQFIQQGFVLGFGGAMTFERALQIRRLAECLPLDSLVLETDAPDIPPAWLGKPGGARPRNEPGEVARIGQEMAKLRGLALDDIIDVTAENAFRALPRLSLAGV
ncbi:MAG TPA: TatD family hydrolase [Burkholderiaceae bacterium]|nr:TatD family hydrolase [Burkholderiaceae bacterium]